MKDARLYTLENNQGMTMKVSSLGGIVAELTAPDREGRFADVLLGRPRVEEHHDSGYMSALIGRVGNRIRDGQFVLDGVRHQVPLNSGSLALHGGREGFDQKIWSCRPLASPEGPALELTYLSPDGEEGFPGNLFVRVVYTLMHINAWRLQYWAVTDAPTVVNLTHHAYFNLNGGAADIRGHVLQMDCSRVTPADATLLPTGEVVSVAGTPLDFAMPTPIGARVDDTHELIAGAGGYDHNYIIDRVGPGLARCAVLDDPASGRRMEAWTTEPCVQLYSANFLAAGTSGKHGRTYGPRHGVCLETQHAPDSPNQPGFRSIRLDPGQVMQSTTIYKFTTF
ncbi:MAG: aldose epimerase family protein [Kiritimatiellia bacterium]|jgi:aldose 1-epimerase